MYLNCCTAKTNRKVRLARTRQFYLRASSHAYTKEEIARSLQEIRCFHRFFVYIVKQGRTSRTAGRRQCSLCPSLQVRARARRGNRTRSIIIPKIAQFKHLGFLKSADKLGTRTFIWSRSRTSWKSCMFKKKRPWFITSTNRSRSVSHGKSDIIAINHGLLQANCNNDELSSFNSSQRKTETFFERKNTNVLLPPRGKIVRIQGRRDFLLGE
jgi:hypothetical protein